MPYMNKLKIILQSKLFYLLIIIFTLVYVFTFTKLIKYNSKYKNGENVIVAKVISSTKKDKELKLLVKDKEKIKVNYYNDKIPEIEVGSTIEINCEISDPLKNTIPNTFNYQNYLYNNKIYKICKASKITTLNKPNLINKIKNVVINRINSYDNSNTYLNLFILGDKSYLDNDIYNLYKDNGIAHLLAISGMHLSLFILILKKIFSFIKEKKQNIIIVLFLIFYLFLCNYTISMLRCFFFYFISLINNLFNLRLNSIKKIILTGIIIILINPFNIFNVGFLYSYLISFGLILSNKFIKGNYLKKSLIISIISFLISLPITASLNYEINLSSIIINLFMVPYVSFIFYPFSLVTFIFKPLNFIFIYLCNIFYYLNQFFSQFNLMINIPKTNILIIILYYLILYLAIIFNQKKYILLLPLLILYIKIIPKIDSNYYIYYLDIGQGDSSLLISPYKKEIIMIDTGGNPTSKYKVSDGTLLLLKSLGITSINTIIISHGDSDHCYDTLNIINNINVKNVMLNNGDYNELETNIINSHVKINNKVNLKYFKYTNLKEEIYNEENKNSLVNYFTIYNYKLLFVGDSPIDTILPIIKKESLNNITFYKLGHHGSKTSTNEEIIKLLKPKYTIISAGRNNIYHHPSNEVIDILNKNKINYFNTQVDGSIEIIINKNDYKINTYNP
jgi:competence protein ComEC